MIERLGRALGDRYRIERELGEGGMATVYLAEDLKHDRQVAIKVLKPELAAVIGAERFVAEIKTTAALQHPHILPLFDSGEADGFLYYVMPYIEGESLRDRLDREKQLGVEEALSLTRDVADALDYAHRQGVIHRDIKPANILLHDGRPVVADFGIAVAISAAGGGRLTETGLSLGTPHYMSPEQATADRDLTVRSDVYSLGCVLYEMLTGDPPHTASTAQAVLVRILTEPPRPADAVRPSVPPHVSAALAKALEKLPADRFKSAEEFSDALDDPLFRWETRTRAEAAAPASGAPRGAAPGGPGRRTLVPWAVAGAALLGMLWMALAGGSGGGARVARLDLSLGELERPSTEEVVISPDGSMLVISAEVGGEQALYLRRIGEPTFARIPGTQDGEKPVFSPDSRWILYRRDGELLRVAPDGGGGLTVFADESVDAWNPHWGADGTIAFTGPQGVHVLPPDGPTRAVSGDGSRPFVLPDGSGLLNWTDQGVLLTDLATDSTRMIVPEGAHPTYLDSGHLLYLGPGGGLFAQPFDLDGHALSGTPLRVLDEVSWGFHRRGYSVADDGTLVVLHGPAGSSGAGGLDTRFLLFDRAGGADTVRLPPAPRYAPQFSPDGRFLAYELYTGTAAESNVHTYDLVTGFDQPVTFEGDNETPIWSPDGTRLLFDVEDEDADEDLHVKWVDNREPKELLLEHPGDQNALSWIEGDVLLFESVSTGTGMDLYTMRLGEENPAPEPYLQSPWDEEGGRLSPDGTLVVYESDETGETEVWLRTFPDPAGRWRISTGGAGEPRWDPTARGVYFWTETGERFTLMFAPVEREPSVRPGALEETGITVPGVPMGWDVHPEGEPFVVVQESGARAGEGGDAAPSRYYVVLDWFAELDERLETGR